MILRNIKSLILLSAIFFQTLHSQCVPAEKEEAINKVKQIVNQSVDSYPRDNSKQIGIYPGWFHPGATEPNYATVDVSTTQENPYSQWEYVASSENPNVMYRGTELEFNSNTKFFYTDRSLPKRRLSADEMQEINRLYRIIGRCQATSDETAPNENIAALLANRDALMVVGILIIGYFVFYRRRSA